MFEDGCVLIQFTVRRGPGDLTGKKANARRRAVRKLLDEYGAEKIDESSYCISPGVIPADSFGLKLRNLLKSSDWFQVGKYKFLLGQRYTKSQELIDLISRT